jgi:hypothetical protein
MPIHYQPAHRPDNEGHDPSGPDTPPGEQIGARDPMEEDSRLHCLAVARPAQGQYTEALAASQQALALGKREVGVELCATLARDTAPGRGCGP